MAVAKRSISFDETVLAEAERLSAERGGNLSAFVNEAVERSLKVALGRKLVEADEERWGPIPDEAVAEIEALWPD